MKSPTWTETLLEDLGQLFGWRLRIRSSSNPSRVPVTDFAAADTATRPLSLSMPIVSKDGMALGLLDVSSDQSDLSFEKASALALLLGRTLDAERRSRERIAALEDELAISKEGEERLLKECDALATRNSKALREATDRVRLAEQFAAVLGHDLRNSLQAVLMAVDLLGVESLGTRQRELATEIRDSSKRMANLVRNTLDLAHGSLGSGIPVTLAPQPNLLSTLKQVVTEIKRANPHRTIEFACSMKQIVSCDQVRITQLLSNLLDNAVKYGSPEEPVLVEAHCQAGEFKLTVQNGGKPIPSDKLSRMFEPFRRGAGSDSPPGLGLGLYIASEIAKAHGGTLEVTSTDVTTRFVLRMPLQS